MAENNGVTLVEALARLVPKKRGKGRLVPAPAREAIAVSVAEAVPNGANPTGASLVSPWLEQAYTGSTYYELVSSDGLFVFEYPDRTTYIDNDGAGAGFVVKHLAP